MAALVTGYRYALDIFLNGGIHDLLNRAIVSQVNHLHPGILQYPAHDVDGGIMTIKKRCCRNDSYIMPGFINVDLSFRPHAASLIWNLILFRDRSIYFLEHIPRINWV